jgi:hypothetical protein
MASSKELNWYVARLCLTKTKGRFNELENGLLNAIFGKSAYQFAFTSWLLIIFVALKE